MSNLRNTTVLMTNRTTEKDPATMTITNAATTTGKLLTDIGDGISVEPNGGNKAVKFEANSGRGGTAGSVTYSVQNIKNSNVVFTNTMTERHVEFRIGNNVKTYKLKDNGSKVVKFGGFSWRFDVQSNGLEYTINVVVAKE